MPDDDADNGSAGSSTDEDSNRIRETAKWLIVTCGGGILATAFAGLKLTDLNELEGDSLNQAYLGLAIATAGVLAAVAAAAIVLTKGSVGLERLRDAEDDDDLLKSLDKHDELHGGKDSTKELIKRFDDANKALAEAHNEYLEDPSNDSKDAAFNNAKATVVWWRGYVERVLTEARYEVLRDAWSVARWVILAGGAAGVVGAVVFAAATPPQSATPDAVARRPVYVTVSLTDKGKEVHAGSLGDSCKLTAFDAVATNSTADSVDVLVLPARGDTDCQLTTLTLKRGEANYQRADSVEVPDLTPAAPTASPTAGSSETPQATTTP